MENEGINELFEKIRNVKDWESYALIIKKNKKFECIQLRFEEKEIIKDLLNNYLDSLIDENDEQTRYSEIIEYNATTDEQYIQKIPKNIEGKKIEEIKIAIKESKTEKLNNNDTTRKINGIIFRKVSNGEEKNKSKEIIIVNCYKPFNTKKITCVLVNNKLKKYDKSFYLKETIDLLIIDDDAYILNKQAESLFEANKKLKEKAIKNSREIVKESIISEKKGIELFEKVAASGLNPRRFGTYNYENVKELKKKDVIQKISKTFNLQCDKNNHIIIESEEDAVKLIKIICDKAMKSPFDDVPMEVSYAKRWTK